MKEEDQKQEITRSLRLITKIFEECQSEYRILGSLILVAHKHIIFRRINDIDILLDRKSQQAIFKKVIECGFVLKKKSWGGFIWTEAYKENFLSLTFFLTGEFIPQYFSYPFMKWCELRIKADYLQPTRYTFNNISFIGIPLSSAISGIYQAFLNPKRSLDKRLLSEEIKTIKVKPYGNIYVCIAGIRIPYLYDVFSFFYNIYGGLRVTFGKKYEAWD